MCSVIPCGTVLSSNVKETFVEFSWNFTSVRKIDEKESTTNDEGGAKFSRSPFSSNGTRTYTIWHRVPCQSKVKCFPFYGTPFVRIRSNVYIFFLRCFFQFLASLSTSSLCYFSISREFSRSCITYTDS